MRVARLKWKIAQFTELRWWQHYLKDKSPEDYLKWKKNYWYGLLNKAAISEQLKDKKRILDAGCGPAGIFTILDKHEVTAIDPLIDHYAETLNHFNPQWYRNVRFLNQTIESFEDKQPFDIVFCMNALNHVCDIHRALNNLVNLMKVGGMILLTVDVHKTGILKRTFQLIPGDILHPHQYRLSDYLQMLEDRGIRNSMTVPIKEGFIFNHTLIAGIKNE